MIVITKYLVSQINNINVDFTIFLTSDERKRSQQRIELENGQSLYLRLPRGKIMQNGDILQSENEEITVMIVAKPEPVITVTAANQLDLIKAAYHLGNRHISLEITDNYLRFSPDHILESMLINMGLIITQEIAPFAPETGAYVHHH